MTLPTRFLCASMALTLMALTACREQSSRVTGPDLALPVSAAKTPSTIAVGMTIKDRDAAAALLLTRSDNPNAGAAPYTGGVITSTGGAFQLYLGNQTSRTIWLTLATQGMGIPDGYYYSDVELYAQCYTDASGTTLASLTAMNSGASNSNCSFGVDFSSGGVKYKLAMSPLYAGTGHALVTCTAQGSGGCTGWSVVPESGVASSGVARLFKYAKSGSLVTVGDYHNSYAVAVTR